MPEYKLSDLDEETQQRLKRNPIAMMAYEILGPPAPRPLFKSREEFEAAAEKIRKELEPAWEKYRIAAARSMASARDHVLD